MGGNGNVKIHFRSSLLGSKGRYGSFYLWVKLCDPLSTRAIAERHRDERLMISHCTNLQLFYFTFEFFFQMKTIFQVALNVNYNISFFKSNFCQSVKYCGFRGHYAAQVKC